LTLDVKKSNSSNETPNVMTVGVENYGLKPVVYRFENITRQKSNPASSRLQYYCHSKLISVIHTVSL
jgi:hypothetical protein